MMDRWQISLSDVQEVDQPGDPMPYNIINNYFSIGVVSGHLISPSGPVI